MMSDSNPFLEGYKSAILGKRSVCPYADGSAEGARWLRGSGGVIAAMAAAPIQAVVIPVLEGRRPFVEGYRAAIFGGREACFYEEGTAEFARWWKGFRGWTGTAKTPITAPVLEGRRPFVDGYKAAILGRPREDVMAEYEGWGKAAPWWSIAKAERGQAAYR